MKTAEFLMVRRAGAITVSRPRGVVHAYVGPRTPSGWFVPRSHRTVCRAHTRRLAAVAPSAASTMCARCSARLLSQVGRAEHSLRTRDDYATAYAGLRVRDLLMAVALTRTVEETHTVGRLALLLLGPAPVLITAASTREQRERYELEQRILQHRRHWAAVELTDTERQANADQRAAETFNDDLAKAARRKEAATDRAEERARRGSYLTPYERSLVS